MPRGLGALSRLEVLQLGQLRPPLDELFARCRGLSTLVLNACNLSTLSNGVSALSRLTELALTQNKLAKLPPGISCLSRLDCLDVS
jgi:Leucine-rich repeat (LRR) protein